MKIHYGSDIHLEFGRGNLKVPSNPDQDVLVLAGDILVVAPITFYLRDKDRKDCPISVKYKYKDQHDRYKKFLTECSKKYHKVFMVFGNHEFYYGCISDAISKFNTLLDLWDLTNITVLDNFHETFEGVTFFGGTLWTDYNNGDPMAKLGSSQMNDFSCIIDEDNWKITPDKFQELNLQFRLGLQQLLKEGLDNPVVVISHHAPSLESINPAWRSSNMNYLYANTRMDDMLVDPQIAAWIHGHTHSYNCYKSCGGEGCLVLCNPRGYLGYTEKFCKRPYEFLEFVVDAVR